MKVATFRCTSGMRHCGLSPPRTTGVKIKVGSEVARSAKYLLQTRSIILAMLVHRCFLTVPANLQVQLGYERPSKGESEERIWAEKPPDLGNPLVFSQVPTVAQPPAVADLG